MRRVDAHQHFWRLARGDYHWLNAGGAALAPLQRNFEPADLAPLRAAHGVEATVLVQAAASEAETEHLLALADAEPAVAGVVGWIDLADRSRLPVLRRWARHPRFKGVRPMLQDLAQPDWLDHGPDAQMVTALIDLGLRFDALVRPAHLPALLRFARRWPVLPLVVDHAAKPPLAAGRAADRPAWRDGLARLAQLPQVHCKFSGLLTEAAPADDAGWRDPLRTVWETLCDTFGAQRLMWGSDWPVLTVAADYGRWVGLAAACIDTLDAAGRAAVWSGTAQRFYGLDLPPDAAALR